MNRRVTRRVLLLLLAALALATALQPLPERLSTPSSPVLRWRDGTVMNAALAPDDRWRIAADLDAIDPDLVRALVALEDERFWWHPGVDPLAVLRAAWTNLSRGRVVSGASTLTMQVVRMSEPRPRTLRSKVIEVWRAFGLELWWSKRQILEAWLRLAPYGGNVEGVEAASWMLFGHDARALSPEEIATLLAIPQDPQGRAPRPATVAALRAARDEVAGRLGAVLGDEQALATLRLAEAPSTTAPLPRRAPHTAERLRLPGDLTTTLDAATQRTAERLAARHRPGLDVLGIHNVATLLVDLPSAEVRAAVGGFDWWDDAHGGNYDATQVPRSPGSALKPLIYALALDRGLALPERLVADVPTRYGTWVVDSFDGTWSGAVRLETALSRSLNVPFVDLLARIGTPTLTGTLQQCGAGSLVPTAGHYGLSAAVGGIELTPTEMAAVWLPLLADGACRPLRWTTADPISPGLPMYSPGAAWLTRRALRLRDRPDTPTRRDLGALSPSIAWKTGTSQGHHDAWAVGSDGRTLAVVWLGNLDQRPSHHLVGADSAAPLLFDLLEAVAPADPAPDPRPPDLAPLDVCALSGHLPGPACPRTSVVWGPRATLPPDRCPYHVELEVDDLTGLAVGPGCRAGPSHTAAFLSWPPAVRRFLDDLGGDLPERPAPAPGCVPPGTGGPVILSPTPGQITRLAPGRAPETQEVPLYGESAAGELSWFVDGAWLGATRSGERAWWVPSPGAHEVVAVDQAGATARVRFEVVAVTR